MLSKEIEEYLDSLGMFGWKLGLGRMHEIASAMGNPELDYQVIHIAGSNGKGSTAGILESIFTASGKKVGVYTSPHLISPCERIRIDGLDVTSSEFESAIRELKPIFDANEATYFEVMTATAFFIFQRCEVDLAIVETGLGGRLDATNIVSPDCTIITTISLEHEAILGDTIAKIAAEKGGIIKPGAPVVFGKLKEEAREVLTAICRREGSVWLTPHANAKTTHLSQSANSQTFRFEYKGDDYGSVSLPLPGQRQLENFITAFGCAKLFMSKPGLKKCIQAGLMKLKTKARLEIVSHSPPILIDVAHNPDSVLVLIEYLQNYYRDRRIFVIAGVLADKDYVTMLSFLKPVIHELFCVTPKSSRSLPADSLDQAACNLAVESSSFKTLEAAYQHALNVLTSQDLLVITGSHYVVGEFLKLYESKIS